MKWFLFLLAILALVVLGQFAYQVSTRTAPAIAIFMEDEDSGGTDYVPAISGYVSGHGASTSSHGRDEVYHADMTYKVISPASEHFTVLAHYIITRNGISTSIDRTLPVREKQPDKTQWVKLDNHLIACAYLSNTQLHY